jgi:hypothetical protein
VRGAPGKAAYHVRSQYCHFGARGSRRLRRWTRLQHHFVSPKHLDQYANHAAWLEDNRRNSNGTNAAELTGMAMAHDVSRAWKGYWQRNAK